MKFFLSLFTLFLFSIVSSQRNFYIEIANEEDVPKIIQNQGKITLVHTTRDDITNIFSKHRIYSFEKSFPIAKTPRLKRIYSITCDDSKLPESLVSLFGNKYVYYEELLKPELLLYTPNDYNLPSNIFERKNLDLINIKEAWDYSHGNSSFMIGISDSPPSKTHEDLAGKIYSLINYNAAGEHGTFVSSLAAANTNNGLGIPGTGFNSSILYSTDTYGGLLQLSANGARVINASWGYCNYTSLQQDIINEIHDNGTVIIAAAGNGGTCGNPDNYVYPASLNHVISVSSVGMAEVGFTIPFTWHPQYGQAWNWRDRVEHLPGQPGRHQTNDKVDLRAAGYAIWGATSTSNNSYTESWGTSLSAPQVAGVVSLLFDVNNCLNPDEVESILKLTSSRLDSISENYPYLGKLGAGRIDAGKAVKMAWQMNPANGGEVLLTNRSFDKWHFELLSSAQKIRMINQEFKDNSDFIFKAREEIVLDDNVLLKPNPDKNYMLLVDNSPTCFDFPYVFSESAYDNKNNRKTHIKKPPNISVYPNPVIDKPCPSSSSCARR